ncbi:hypothetical protein GCM10007170_19240 [Arthrobacter liuii]|uniref:Uncharacterized protein n=1 Tax=Arthrobacter liuii TaxID=1476996 RepID=A0ABQ2AP75_9MICC|nr:hypothetical protein GCM10007170_19240 [Arthrobacter liuii]
MASAAESLGDEQQQKGGKNGHEYAPCSRPELKEHHLAFGGPWPRGTGALERLGIDRLNIGEQEMEHREWAGSMPRQPGDHRPDREGSYCQCHQNPYFPA